MSEIPERALIIRQPWSDHILEERKTWELRDKNTKIRGSVALIEGGSGTIIGMFNIEDTQGPLSREERVINSYNLLLMPLLYKNNVRQFTFVFNYPVEIYGKFFLHILPLTLLLIILAIHLSKGV